jgi:hypothetical protein
MLGLQVMRPSWLRAARGLAAGASRQEVCERAAVGRDRGDDPEVAFLGDEHGVGGVVGQVPPLGGGQLAVAHRPVLRFDTHEAVPRPLDVDAVFRTGDISMCEGGKKIRQLCVQLLNADELQSGFNRLAFDTHALGCRPPTQAMRSPSTRPVHVSMRQRRRGRSSTARAVQGRSAGR